MPPKVDSAKVLDQYLEGWHMTELARMHQVSPSTIHYNVHKERRLQKLSRSWVQFQHQRARYENGLDARFDDDE